MILDGILERNMVFSYLYRLTNNHAYLLTGIALISLYACQLVLNLRWEWLDNLQSDEVYKQFTGFIVFAYVLMQSRLGLQRVRGSSASLSQLHYSHKIQGVFGPVVFYLHSIDIGFAYQVILTFAFLGNCIIGYLSPHTIPIKNKLYYLGWTILHISLAIMTFVLILFHIFVVYYYS